MEGDLNSSDSLDGVKKMKAILHKYPLLLQIGGMNSHQRAVTLYWRAHYTFKDFFQWDDTVQNILHFKNIFFGLWAYFDTQFIVLSGFNDKKDILWSSLFNSQFANRLEKSKYCLHIAQITKLTNPEFSGVKRSVHLVEQIFKMQSSILLRFLSKLMKMKRCYW